jgi:hypothetical protein
MLLFVFTTTSSLTLSWHLRRPSRCGQLHLNSNVVAWMCVTSSSLTLSWHQRRLSRWGQLQ